MSPATCTIHSSIIVVLQLLLSTQRHPRDRGSSATAPARASGLRVADLTILNSMDDNILPLMLTGLPVPLIVRNERQWEPHCQRQWKGGATPPPLQLAQHITTMGGACVVFQAVGMRQSDLHRASYE